MRTDSLCPLERKISGLQMEQINTANSCRMYLLKIVAAFEEAEPVGCLSGEAAHAGSICWQLGRPPPLLPMVPANIRGDPV